MTEDNSICMHHTKVWLDKFEEQQRLCFDPFERHKKPVKGSLLTLNIEAANIISSKLGKNILPGCKVCPRCNTALNELEMSTVATVGDEEECEMGLAETSATNINSSFAAVGCSPIKITKLNQAQRITYGKRKISQAKEALDVAMATVLQQPVEAVRDGPPEPASECLNCKDLHELTNALKEKCRVSTKQEQYQILTLAPASWSLQRVASEFDVSIYKVRKSRDLKKQCGILAKPQSKKGRPLADHIEQDILNFYEDNDISRICPGAKDYVSVKVEPGGPRVHKQKRLLLCNLKELYIEFKEKTGHRVGFAKFCKLRPKWCITVGASGTHNVCVCTIHQNVKLMLAALNTRTEYPELIEKLVCDVNSRNCMLHRCEACPGKPALKQYLEQLTENDYDPEDDITFNQWVHVDRSNLVTQQLTVEEFIDELVKKVDALTTHDYIAKHQSAHLRQLKDNLPNDVAIIILDFSENYAFVIQDASQSFYWDNSSATLHPVAVYYRDGNVTKSLCYNCISNCMKHETVTVYAFQKIVLAHLRQHLPQIKKVIYFSDGAASQYKNYKNFTNICYHLADFALQAEWHFFATSHGKNICDGIGGTTKRLSRRASLQATTEGQIRSALELFNWCDHNIKNIKFFYVTQEDVDANRDFLQQRFTSAHTIPGTRDNHSFIPLSTIEIRVSRVSQDDTHFTVQLSAAPAPQMLQMAELQVGQYIAGVYDSQWWVGNILDKSDEYSDVHMRFMHPHGPATSFKWPDREDKCWVPLQHVLCIIPSPATTGTARHYKLSKKNKAEIIKAFKDFTDN